MNDRVSQELLAAAAAQAATQAIADAADVIDFERLITIEDHKLVADSLGVAKAFKKAHKYILRQIDQMRDSKQPEIANHWRLNFEPRIRTYKTGKGQTRQSRMYLMTKDGLSELAMSFTGDRARLVRIRFIAAFNAMADQLQNQGNNLVRQFFATEVQYTNEKSKVSASARNMRLWQKKKPELTGTMDRLRADIQLKLGLEVPGQLDKR
ncbi:hypothetical protein GJ699_02375 [Duganella sp. FT80W]|uniref:Rha family transcriptional regulator n=1 Tax=Duganella guangzhouensis TaxID=2666084 RepID=A0A6I2KX82_9BURK|nr:Rha family transcriptional regulator [Duganella guangzhouensis]MRW88826.1 hypothetical protein [Duganella guangzhouensis]